MKAELVKNLDGWTGDARLYRLTPPLVEKDWDGNKVGEHEFVVVSATVAMFSGPETYIFAADKEGVVASYGELDGSYRGGLDHAEALAGAGYEVAYNAEVKGAPTTDATTGENQ